MARNSLEIGVPATLVALGLAATFGLSGLTPSQTAAYQAQISAYMDDIQAGWADVSENAPRVAPTPASVTGQTPLAAALSIENVRPPIGTYVPDAPDGWSMAPTAPGDYLAMAGVPPIDWNVVNPAVADLEQQMAAHIASQSETRMRDRNVEIAAMTYRQGDQMALVYLRYIPAATFDGPEGAEFGLLQEMMRGLCQTEYGAAEARPVQDVTFEGTPIEGSADGRRFVGFIGPQIDIRVYTNAGDDVVDALLADVDVDRLRDLVELGPA